MEHKGTYYGDAYCVKCKEKVDFEGDIRVSDSGRRMAQGKCPKCNTVVNRILGKEQYQEKPAKAQEVVSLPPLPYATIKVHNDGWRWYAEAKDTRRPMFGNVEFFSASSRDKVVKKATEWIDSYEVIEFFYAQV